MHLGNLWSARPKTLLIIANLSCFLLLIIIFLIFSLQIEIAVILALVLLFFGIHSGEKFGAILITVPIVVVVLIFELSLRLMPLQSQPSYFRPHEMLIIAGETLYKSNQDISFDMPYGDLFAISEYLFKDIKVPRKIRFITDEIGLRNTGSYEGQKHVLFGDSYVVGNGTSQEDILSEVLMREHNIPVYNAAFPSGMDGYIKKYNWLREKYGNIFEAIIVIFEGNDFWCPPEEYGSQLQGVFPIIATPGFVRNLEAYRYFYGLTRRGFMKIGLTPYETKSVIVRRLGKENVAFYRLHDDTTRRKESCNWGHFIDKFKVISQNIRLFVFVPTKYRVYYPLIENRDTLPNIHWEYLLRMSKILNIPVINLTPQLRSAAKRLLDEGKYVYWRDDTHWNPEGISVAARAIAEVLRAMPVKK